jgi:hypothetical protein
MKYLAKSAICSAALHGAPSGSPSALRAVRYYLLIASYRDFLFYFFPGNFYWGESEEGVARMGWDGGIVALRGELRGRLTRPGKVDTRRDEKRRERLQE